MELHPLGAEDLQNLGTQHETAAQRPPGYLFPLGLALNSGWSSLGETIVALLKRVLSPDILYLLHLCEPRMPGQWTVSGAAAVEALEAWEACFSNCLEQSLDYKRFLEAVSKQYFKIPLNGQGILEAWVKSYGNLVVPDSRLSTYFEQLLHTGRVADLDVLTWLYEMFKTSLPNQDRFAVTFAFTGEKVSRTEKGWKPMVEAEVLNKMAYQMKHHRNIRIKANDTVPDSRLCKPLMACLSIFNETLAGTNPLIGPALQIGNALAKFVEAYIHELSIVGLLNCKDGSPPDGT